MLRKSKPGAGMGDRRRDEKLLQINKCNHKKEISTMADTYSGEIVYKDKDEELFLPKGTPVLVTYSDHGDYGYKIPVKYCPWCGEKLV
jgi:hypothetical protein